MSEVIHPTFGIVSRNDTPTKPSAPSILPDDIFTVEPLSVEDFDKQSVPIPEVAYGQTIVGTLTDEETLRFMAINVLRDRFARINKDATVMSLQSASKSLANFSTIQDYIKAQEAGDIPKQDLSEDDIERIYKLETLISSLTATLMFDIRNRLSIFRFKMGIRSKRRVVTLSEKYSQTPE